MGEAHLYFGCRNPDHDYLYKNELETAQQEDLVQLHIAFSRVDGEEKCYVQHLMRDDARKLIPLLEQGGHLYICGDGSKMAPDVEVTLKKAYADISGNSSEQAETWLERIQQEGRYAKDVWTGLAGMYTKLGEIIWTSPPAASLSLDVPRHACRKLPCLERKFSKICFLRSFQTRPNYWISC